MTEQIIVIGRINHDQYGRATDLTEKKRFFGEKLTETTELTDRDISGMDYTLFKTDDNEYRVHTISWSRWQGSTTYYSISDPLTLEELKNGFLLLYNEAVREGKIEEIITDL